MFLRDAAGTISKGGPDLPESYPATSSSSRRAVTFPSSIDHKTVAGQLFVPEHPTGCGLIFPHGGPSRQMLPGYHYYDTYTVLYEMNQYFASHGCVVLSVDYRGGIMYGNAWRTFPGRGGTSAAEYQDIQGGAAFLLAQPQVDPAKVGIYGLSYGGYLTTLGVSRNSDIFHVAWDMAGNSGNAAVANLASWTAPILIEQGDDDRNVDFSSNVSVVRAIKAQKPSLELATRVFPNEQHEMYMRFEDLVEAYDTGGQWMLTHLFPNQVSAPPLEVGGTVPATLSLTLGGTGELRPVHAGHGEGLQRSGGRLGDIDRRRRIAERERSRPPDERHVRTARAAAGHVQQGELDRAGDQRPGHDRLQAAHQRQRHPADGHVRQDADVHVVDDDAIAA